MPSENSPQSFSLLRLKLKSLKLAAFSVLFNVLVFAGAGWYVDKLLDKQPTFFIIGMVLAFVFTNVLIIFLEKKFSLSKK